LKLEGLGHVLLFVCRVLGVQVCDPPRSVSVELHNRLLMAHQIDEYASQERIRQSVAIYEALIRDRVTSS
jgi:hypothetical protein